MSAYQVEACVTSYGQALKAEQLGAHRIEICDHLETGGLTPDFLLVSTLCLELIIPMRVMIRNTAVRYEADANVIEAMISSLEMFKDLPVEGFVYGVMKDGRIDQEAMKILLQHTHGKPVTFHKAIDDSPDVDADLSVLNQWPEIDTILSSGGEAYASDAVVQLKRMQSIFKGNIMAGGKILKGNVEELHAALNFKWYHGRGIVGDLGK